MSENFASLVFFTVLSQTAAGALIFRELLLLSGGYKTFSFRLRKTSLIVISLFLLTSLAIAFFHLGKPLAAINAINNLGRSWLSREIFSLSMLLASLLAYLTISIKNSYKTVETIFSIIIITCCLSFIYSMIMLYMIPAVVSWNNPFTPISFVITTLLCGSMLLMAIIGKADFRYNRVATIFISVFIILSFSNSIIFQGTYLKGEIPLLIIRTTLSAIALMITLLRIFWTQTNKRSISWVILFIMVISSEIISRYMFFLSFEKSGL